MCELQKQHNGSVITGLPGYWLDVLFTVCQPQIYPESL